MSLEKMYLFKACPQHLPEMPVAFQRKGGLGAGVLPGISRPGFHVGFTIQNINYNPDLAFAVKCFLIHTEEKYISFVTLLLFLDLF